MKLLVVCLGNICRSPAAEAILKQLVEADRGFKKGEQQNGLDLEVESCAIGEWHLGQLPDPRMRKAARARGLDLTSKAQLFQASFFKKFDLILAVDREIHHWLMERAPEHAKGKVRHLGDFSSTRPGEDIADPYQGRYEDFDQALDHLEEVCFELIQTLKKS